MKTKQEFLNYYAELIKNDNDLTQKQKDLSTKTSYQSVYKFFGILGLVGVGILLLISLLSGDVDVLIALGIFVVVGALLFFPIFILITKAILPYVKKQKALRYFEEKYKHRLVTYLLDDKIYSYRHEEKMDQKVFKESGMFGSYNRYYGEDLMTIVAPSVHGDLVFNFSDLDVQHVTKDKDGNDQTHTVFRGVFGVCYLTKPFSFSISVNSRINFKQEKVNLESIEFNKKFKVYTDDQISARVIFTPDRMEKILAFHATNSNKAVVNVQQNKIYFGAWGANLFKPIVESQSKNITAEDFYYDVKMLENLIELLKQILDDVY